MFSVQFFLFVLLAEVLILFLMLISLVIERSWRFILCKKRLKHRLELTSLIEKAMHSKNHQMAKLPKRLTRLSLLVEVLITMEKKETGLTFHSVKNHLIAKYALAKARKMSCCFFHKKRLLAAAVLRLYATEKERSSISRLLDDKNLLIAAVAAHAAVNIGDRALIEKILQNNQKSSMYVEATCKEALIHAPPCVHKIVEQILKTNQQPAVLSCGIDILAQVGLPIPPEALKKAQACSAEKVKEAVLRAYIVRPCKHSCKVFIEALDDKSPTIRSIAARGMALFPSQPHADLLERILADPCWQVRLEAASSLYLMGKQGKAVLKGASKKREEKIRNSAQFILKVAEELDL